LNTLYSEQSYEYIDFTILYIFFIFVSEDNFLVEKMKIIDFLLRFVVSGIKLDLVCSFGGVVKT